MSPALESHPIADLLHDEPAFVLRVVHAGFASLTEVPVSTVAAIFATQRSHTVVLTDIAAATGAGWGGLVFAAGALIGKAKTALSALN